MAMTTRTSVRRNVAHPAGEGAATGIMDVGDTFQDAIDRSLESRPYTTLLLAVGLGFLLGAFWAR
jgi:hypothetical protein